MVGDILAPIAEMLAHLRRQTVTVGLLQQLADAAYAGL